MWGDRMVDIGGEEWYIPNFYVECQPSLNLSKSIYKKHEKTHNSPQKTTKKLINLVRNKILHIYNGTTCF
jgi:hypothetical protein